VSHDTPPKDHAPPDASESSERSDERSSFDTNIRSRSTWLRLLFMLVMIALLIIAQIVGAAVVLIQFCYKLFTGSTHKPLTELGQALATYLYEIARYLTFNTDTRPFPFDASWPQEAARPDASAGQEDDAGEGTPAT
jgi:hypothetical protein